MCDCTNETGYMTKNELLKWLNVNSSELNLTKGVVYTGPYSSIHVNNLNRNNHPLFTNYQRRKQIKEWRQSQAKTNKLQTLKKSPKKVSKKSPNKSSGNNANAKAKARANAKKKHKKIFGW